VSTKSARIFIVIVFPARKKLSKKPSNNDSIRAGYLRIPGFFGPKWEKYAFVPEIIPVKLAVVNTVLYLVL